MQTCNIEDVSAVLADERDYPASNGVKRPDSPAFIFRDERKTPDIVTGWGRDLALDFEEWVAKRNHEEALDSRKESYTLTRDIPQVAQRCPAYHTIKDVPKHALPKPTKQDEARAKLLTRLDPDHVTINTVPLTPLFRKADGSLNSKGLRLQAVLKGVAATKESQGSSREIKDDFEAPTPEDVLEYLERQDARGFCNWLIGNAKRRVPTNDHWRRLVMPLVSKLDDPVLGETAKCILATLKRELPFAPSPVKGTVFLNPDGSRYETAGTDYGKARASFIKRHKLDEEFVSAERVQYEGERGSKIVVGTRRSSEATPSRYYDPNPAWQDTVRKTGYLPNNAAFLVMINLASPVMPSGSHRLTVREFEQALIAGAEIMDDACERTAHELEEEYLPDARVLMINVGYGSAQYDPMVFTHEEEQLVGLLRKFAKDADDSFWKDAIELAHLRDEDKDVMRDHFHSGGKPTPQLVDLLDYISWMDKNIPSEDGPFLPYALTTLTQYGEAEYVSPTAESYSNAVALFDDDEHAWEIPTATGVRLCTFRNWK